MPIGPARIKYIIALRLEKDVVFTAAGNAQWIAQASDAFKGKGPNLPTMPSSKACRRHSLKTITCCFGPILPTGFLVHINDRSLVSRSQKTANATGKGLGKLLAQIGQSERKSERAYPNAPENTPLGSFRYRCPLKHQGRSTEAEFGSNRPYRYYLRSSKRLSYLPIRSPGDSACIGSRNHLRTSGREELHKSSRHRNWQTAG